LRAGFPGGVHVDLGSGDGRAPYRWARERRERLFVAVDANAGALEEIAWRAARKPARGGVANLVCIAATPEQLAAEVPHVADQTTILLPWGSLLLGVARPEPALLTAVRTLCRPGAALEIVCSHDERDHLPGLDALDDRHVTQVLPAAYAHAGLRVTTAAPLDAPALRRYPTTWAQRLAAGRPRRAWRIDATAA
jgi:16S rRNA (adenine(1408)-N(1))-methyltransferase